MKSSHLYHKIGKDITGNAKWAMRIYNAFLDGMSVHCSILFIVAYCSFMNREHGTGCMNNDQNERERRTCTMYL